MNESPGRQQANNRTFIYIAVILLSAVVIAALVMLFAKIIKNHDTRETETVYTPASLTDTEDDVYTEPSYTVSEESDPVTDPSGPENNDTVYVSSDFTITPGNVPDYGSPQVLDHLLYNRGGTSSRYTFSYPASLFNEYCESDEESPGECYGTRIRMDHFLGADNTYAFFDMYMPDKKGDTYDIASMSREAYDNEISFIAHPVEAANGLTRDGNSYIVILRGYTGESEEVAIYNLIKVEPEYVYNMKLYYPAPKDEEERLHTDYYLECMYRMCSFSDHEEAPRSYGDFLKSKENRLPIEEPVNLSFSSGAYGWKTRITVNGNGEFTGRYTDHDSDDRNYRYPAGTVYRADFYGRFSDIEMIDDHTYRMKLDYYCSTHTKGNKEIMNNVRYIYTVPFGIERGDIFYFYLPGKPVSELNECFIGWSMGSVGDISDQETMECYGLYNEATDEGFFGY